MRRRRPAAGPIASSIPRWSSKPIIAANWRRICARRWRRAPSNCTISRRSICAAIVSPAAKRHCAAGIPEAALRSDGGAALAALNQLAAVGAHIALDDFGTSYSSVQYLQRFPLDKIKIDRSFVKEVTRASSSASIIRAVVSIAVDRNMVTTAEGVETPQQRETVQTLGCTQMQGFLFSAARPAQEIRTLLASGDAGVDAAA